VRKTSTMHAHLQVIFFEQTANRIVIV